MSQNPTGQSRIIFRIRRQDRPVTYASNCLEEVCGAWTMLINGKARQACSAFVELKPTYNHQIGDRDNSFYNPVDYGAHPPLREHGGHAAEEPITQELQKERYVLSRCISCASCLEACPQYTTTNRFTGAAIFSQVKLFNIHPTGKALKDDRLDVMMAEGGIADCSKAGNCVVVCPKNLPNLESIATIGRQATVHAIKRFFSE